MLARKRYPKGLRRLRQQTPWVTTRYGAHAAHASLRKNRARRRLDRDKFRKRQGAAPSKASVREPELAPHSDQCADLGRDAHPVTYWTRFILELYHVAIVWIIESRGA